MQVIEAISSFDNLPTGNTEGMVYLFDKSGGRGIVCPEFPKPPPSVLYTGFAGGINKDNVVQNIEQISALRADGEFWLCMESSLRKTAKGGFDIFDLEICEEIAQKVAPYITPKVDNVRS